MPEPEQLRQLEVLANSAAVALENPELRNAVGRRGAERDRMAARADELHAAMHTLVHDLRGPLGAMMGFAELIVDGTDNTSGANYADAVLRAGDRMVARIDRMLSMYRITSRPIEPDTINVSEIASGIDDDLLMQNRDLQIEIEPGLAATADPVLVHLALENFLGNAVKYSPKKASAHVRLRMVPADLAACPDLVGFEVSDDGDGFDPESADRLSPRWPGCTATSSPARVSGSRPSRASSNCTGARSAPPARKASGRRSLHAARLNELRGHRTSPQDVTSRDVRTRRSANEGRESAAAP